MVVICSAASIKLCDIRFLINVCMKAGLLVVQKVPQYKKSF